MQPANLWKREEVRAWLALLFDPGDRVVPAAYVDTGSHHNIPKRANRKEPYAGFTLRPHKAELAGYVYHDDGTAPARSYDLVGDLREVNVVKHYGVAASLAAFGLKAGETERDTVAIKAFGLDIDQKNFESICPGGDKLQVIQEAIRKLDDLGIRPHLVVNSGSGFHLYVLIERFAFNSDDDRLKFKRVWYQLANLWSRTDKHDLTSKLRPPGSIHWKHGIAKPTGFIHKLCALNRPRYSFEQVANAVRQVPVEVEISLADESVKKGNPKKPKAETSRTSPVLELPVLVQLAIDQDAQLRKILKKELTKTYTRSEQDFAVALRLIELGTPTQAVEEYLTQTPKAFDHSKPEHYASQTLGKVLEKRESLFLPVTSAGCGVSEVLDFEAHINRNRTLGGEKDVATSKATKPPQIQVVMRGPGKGKTSGIVDWLARDDRDLNDKRIGFCGAFVNELLINEININAQFPSGVIDDGGDFSFPSGVPIDRNDPSTYEWRRWKPPDWVTTSERALQVEGLLGSLKRLGYQDISLEQLQTHFLKFPRLSPLAFYLNAIPPESVDERFNPEHWEGHEGEPESEAKKRHQDYIQRFMKGDTRIPMAVVRSSGQAERCLQFLPQSALKTGGPCISCRYRACRANRNFQTEIGDQRQSTQSGAVASRIHWKDCRTPLFTHAAWSTGVLRDQWQQCDVTVFDEKPAHTFRASRFDIYFDRDDGSQLLWRIKPFDALLTKVNKSKGAKFDSLKLKLRTFREELVALLNERCRQFSATSKAKRKSNLLRRPPIVGPLTIDDLALLRRIFDDDEIDEELEDTGVEFPEASSLGALQHLFDVCSAGGESLLWDTWGAKSAQEDSSGKQSEPPPSFRLFKFVSGWSDVAAASRDGSVLLDATAGIDPTYLLLGEFAAERYPENNLNKAKVVVVEKRSKTDLWHTTPQQIVAPLLPWKSVIKGGLLILGPKGYLLDGRGNESESATQLRAVLAGQLGNDLRIGLGTFGALRGRNDLAEFNSVYLLNPYRYTADAYIGLAMLVASQSPVTDENKHFNTVNTAVAKLSIDDRAIATEMIQDLMRSSLRSPERLEKLRGFAHVFLPIEGKAGLVVRVASMLAGCTVVAGGNEYVIPASAVQSLPFVMQSTSPALSVGNDFAADELPKQTTTDHGSASQRLPTMAEVAAMGAPPSAGSGGAVEKLPELNTVRPPAFSTIKAEQRENALRIIEAGRPAAEEYSESAAVRYLRFELYEQGRNGDYASFHIAKWLAEGSLSELRRIPNDIVELEEKLKLLQRQLPPDKFKEKRSEMVNALLYPEASKQNG